MTRRILLAAFWPDILAPRLVYQPAPVYPEMARKARIEGIVKLRVFVNESGRVDRLESVSGHPFLVQAAMDAVRRWRWLPQRILGEPTSFRTEVEVPFRLRGSFRDAGWRARQGDADELHFNVPFCLATSRRIG